MVPQALPGVRNSKPGVAQNQQDKNQTVQNNIPASQQTVRIYQEENLAVPPPNSKCWGVR